MTILNKMYISNKCVEQRSNGKRGHAGNTCSLRGRGIRPRVRRRRDLDANGRRRGRRRERAGRLRAVADHRALRHDHDDQLLVAVAVVLVAADEVERAGAGEGEHGVAVGERVDRRARVAGIVRLLVDEQHRIVAGLVRERCVQQGKVNPQ